MVVLVVGLCGSVIDFGGNGVIITMVVTHYQCKDSKEACLGTLSTEVFMSTMIGNATVLLNLSTRGRIALLFHSNGNTLAMIDDRSTC